MEKRRPKICFIDAATNYGVAIGYAGSKPQSWSDRFGKTGASPAAVAWHSMRLVTDIIRKHRPDELVIEAPLPATIVNGKTNLRTQEMLMGLPFAMQGMAYGLQFYNVSIARVSKIRHHFIGSNPKGPEGKQRVWRKCLDLGWISIDDEDLSDNRTDALAGWSYAEHQFAPTIANPIDDLFVAAEKKKREREALAAAAGHTTMTMEAF